MANKTTFEFNGDNINNGFQKIGNIIQKSRVKVSSKNGKTYMNIPFIAALVIAFVIPFIAIVAVILGLLSIIQISIEREVVVVNDQQKLIDSQ